MFAKLFCMFMAVLLLALGGVGLTTYANMRNRQIDARLEELKKQAREIAYLASQNTASAASYFFGSDTTTLDYLNWKAAGVYDDFGAYILVVDRRGQIMTNLKTAYVQDPGFVTSLNQKDLNDALTQVLGGSEISVRAMVDGAPTFTVGVPFVQDGQVLGAVLIQTKAQTIEGEARDPAAAHADRGYWRGHFGGIDGVLLYPAAGAAADLHGGGGGAHGGGAVRYAGAGRPDGARGGAVGGQLQCHGGKAQRVGELPAGVCGERIPRAAQSHHQHPRFCRGYGGRHDPARRSTASICPLWRTKRNASASSSTICWRCPGWNGTTRRCNARTLT